MQHFWTLSSLMTVEEVFHLVVVTVILVTIILVPLRDVFIDPWPNFDKLFRKTSAFVLGRGNAHNRSTPKTSLNLRFCQRAFPWINPTFLLLHVMYALTTSRKIFIFIDLFRLSCWHNVLVSWTFYRSICIPHPFTYKR